MIFRDSVPEKQLEKIVHQSANFPAPLVTLKEREHVLELFHGPTLAFKDFGARFMARLMGWLTREDEELLTVLVATSGDTGGAVASAFHNVPGTRVVILYPKGKVSDLQEKQLTTLGGNITSLLIDGTFDDCQTIVKKAFSERPFLKNDQFLLAVNSINWVRIIGQICYYFYASLKISEFKEPLNFSVPTGNFGNVFACYSAHKMGMPLNVLWQLRTVMTLFPPICRKGNIAQGRVWQRFPMRWMLVLRVISRGWKMFLVTSGNQ